MSRALTARAVIDPEDCATMADVRAGVDALDDALVTLLARRFRYMDVAARIKPTRDAVRDETRKAEVVAHARAVAAREGAPEAPIADFYERLVEASIAYELEQWDAHRL